MFANVFCYFCNIFTHVSTPRRTTRRTTKLLLGPLNVARGQRKAMRIVYAIFDESDNGLDSLIDHIILLRIDRLLLL